MSDIEIHIKTGTMTYENTFDAGDKDAAKEARECVAFILDRVAGSPTSKTRKPRTTAKKPTPVTTVPPKPVTSTDPTSQR